MMIHAFMLVVLLSGAQQRINPMIFYDIERCIYFAEQISTQHTYSAYCKLVWIKDEGQVYK